MKFSNKTQFNFDPLSVSGIDLVTAGEAYATDANHRETLGDLARLSDLRAKFRYSLELNQATANGVINVRLMAGTVELHEFAVDVSAGTRFTGAVDVDVSQVAASTALRVVVNVGTSADAGTTGTIAAALDVVHPVVIVGCS